MKDTVRDVPVALDAALRRRARRERKSLDQVALEALAQSFGLSATGGRVRDLSDISGSWKADPAFDRAIVEQHGIDPEPWKGAWRVPGCKSRPAPASARVKGATP